MEITYKLTDAIGSETGWLYCLHVPRKPICKIGMTTKPSAIQRIEAHLNGKHYSGMEFAWAINDCRIEKGVHRELDSNRMKWTSDKQQTEKTFRDYSVIKTAEHNARRQKIELFWVRSAFVLQYIESANLLNSQPLGRWDASRLPRGAKTRNKTLDLPEHVISIIEQAPHQARFVTNLVEQYATEQGSKLPEATV